MNTPSFTPAETLRGLFGVETGKQLPHDALGLQELLPAGAALQQLHSNAHSSAQILAEMLVLLAGERAFLLEKSVDDPAAFTVICAVDVEGEEVRNPEEKIIPALLVRCLERAEGFYSSELSNEPFAPHLVRGRQPKTRAILVLPLPGESGILAIDHRFQELTLRSADYFHFLWLYSLLDQIQKTRHSAVAEDELEQEIRELRRASRGRRPALVSADPGEAGPLNSPARTGTAGDARGFAGDFTEIVGQSPEIIEVLQVLDKVSATSAPVHIFGESGTGKELIARAIHKNSTRAATPFVSENCAALAETLLESELFGHVRGAYTGATDDRPGLFELAHGGTLFLDEIGDTSAGMQKKLLRALQEGVIRRVGGEAQIRVDVRIISATNKNLAAEVTRGTFREDLYYRLNVINVSLPALRERMQDVPALFEKFVQDLNRESSGAKTYTPEFIAALLSHDWPGNIRELQNQVRRVYALSDAVLNPAHLSPHVLQGRNVAGIKGLGELAESNSLREATERLERTMIEECLRKFAGNRAQVCAELKIPKTTLYAKLRKYRLE